MWGGKHEREADIEGGNKAARENTAGSIENGRVGAWNGWGDDVSAK